MVTAAGYPSVIIRSMEGLVCADNLEVLRELPDGSVNLIYTDPPFGTGKIRRLNSIRTGSGAQSRIGFGGRTYRYQVVSERTYRDDMPFDDFLEFLHARIVEMHRVLTEDGSLYLHLDHHAGHYARLMLDEVFGANHFLNEIIWAYDYGGRHKDRWPRKHDTILWYAKGDDWVFNRDAIDRIPYMAPGLVSPEKAELGKLPTDVWWMTIVPTNSAERTGYPTQKPLGLAKRIIAASSRPDDLVADFFSGSGTVGVAARQLGRRFLLVDSNPEAIAVAGQRLEGRLGSEH